MKVIVTYGFHQNETAAIRICHDWTCKKQGEVYAELSQLAGRPITEKEVSFLDLGKYSAHRSERKFNSKYKLSGILELYRTHIKGHEKGLTKEYRDLLTEYTSIWENADLESSRGLDEVRTKCFALFKNYFGRFCNGAGNSTPVSEKQARKGLGFIFPPELHELVYYPFETKDMTPELYWKFPALKEKLEKAHGRVMVIDLHSKLGNLDEATANFFSFGLGYFIELVGNVYVPSRMGAGKHDLEATLHRHALFGKDVRWNDPTHDFGFMQIEVPYRFVEREVTGFYKEFENLPAVVFLDFLYLVFAGAVYGMFVREGTLLFDIVYNAKYRPKFTDPSFYCKPQFKEAKRLVANIIKDVLDWGEKYDPGEIA